MAHLPNDRETVATGQHDVQNDNIETGGFHCDERVVAVVQDIHRHALLLEGLADK